MNQITEQTTALAASEECRRAMAIRRSINELLEAVKAVLSTAHVCPSSTTGPLRNVPHVRISRPERISGLQAAYDAVVAQETPL